LVELTGFRHELRGINCSIATIFKTQTLRQLTLESMQEKDAFENVENKTPTAALSRAWSK